MAAQDFSRSKIIKRLKDVILLYVIFDDDHKISFLPTSQTVRCFTKDQPKKKVLFSRSLREQKFSNARFRVNSRRLFFFIRDISRINAAKFRADSPRKLSESFK